MNKYVQKEAEIIIQGRERDKYANKGRSMQLRGNRRDNVKSSRDRSEALNRAVPSFVYCLACLPAILCFRPKRIISYFGLAFKSFPLTTSVTMICKWIALISKMFCRAYQIPPKYLLEKHQHISYNVSTHSLGLLVLH